MIKVSSDHHLHISNSLGTNLKNCLWSVGRTWISNGSVTSIAANTPVSSKMIQNVPSISPRNQWYFVWCHSRSSKRFVPTRPGDTGIDSSHPRQWPTCCKRQIGRSSFPQTGATKRGPGLWGTPKTSANTVTVCVEKTNVFTNSYSFLALCSQQPVRVFWGGGEGGTNHYIISFASHVWHDSCHSTGSYFFRTWLGNLAWELSGTLGTSSCGCSLLQDLTMAEDLKLTLLGEKTLFLIGLALSIWDVSSPGLLSLPRVISNQWGFPLPWGYPSSWRVYFLENPSDIPLSIQYQHRSTISPTPRPLLSAATWQHVPILQLSTEMDQFDLLGGCDTHGLPLRFFWIFFNPKAANMRQYST